MQTKYIKFGAMAESLGIPRPYLRELAKTKQVPSLLVNGRLLFDPDAVEAALSRIAAEGGGDAERVLSEGRTTILKEGQL